MDYLKFVFILPLLAFGLVREEIKMNDIKEIKKAVTKVTSNPIGAVAGAAIVWWGINKYAGVSKTWQRAAFAVGGLIIGAGIQSMIKAKMSTPKATLTAKK